MPTSFVAVMEAQYTERQAFVAKHCSEKWEGLSGLNKTTATLEPCTPCLPGYKSKVWHQSILGIGSAPDA